MTLPECVPLQLRGEFGKRLHCLCFVRVSYPGPVDCFAEPLNIGVVQRSIHVIRVAIFSPMGKTVGRGITTACRCIVNDFRQEAQTSTFADPRPARQEVTRTWRLAFVRFDQDLFNGRRIEMLRNILCLRRQI